MNLKKLSPLAYAELGIAENFAGKLFAFTTVIRGSFVGLGIAVANEPGYTPVPLSFAHSDSWALMDAHADELNRDVLGLDEDVAVQIKCSSLAAGPVPPRAKAEGAST